MCPCLTHVTGVHTWTRPVSTELLIPSLIHRLGAINTRNPRYRTREHPGHTEPTPTPSYRSSARKRVAPILGIPTLSLRAQTPPLPNLPQQQKRAVPPTARPLLAAEGRTLNAQVVARRTLTEGTGVHGPDRRYPCHGRRRLACRERRREGRALRRARAPRPAVPARPRVPRPAPCRLLLQEAREERGGNGRRRGASGAVGGQRRAHRVHQRLETRVGQG